MKTPRQTADLSRLVIGNAVSTLGNAIYLVAVLLYLKALTESAFVLGLFQFLALLPAFALSPFTGAIIDLTSRRTIVVQADAWRGVLMIGAGILLFFPSFQRPVVILIVSLGAGIGHAFFVPAAQALIPAIVAPADLETATSVRAVSAQSANLIGNAVGGLLFAIVGMPLLLIGNGVTFLLSAGAEQRISDDGPEAGAPHELGRDSPEAGALHAPESPFRDRLRATLTAARSGLTLVASQRTARLRIVSQAGLFLVSPALMLSLPFIVIDEHGLGPSWVGAFFALSLAGGVIMFGVLRTVRVARLSSLSLPTLAYAVLAAAFAALALSTQPAILAATALATGMAAAGTYLPVVSWIQRQTPPTYHGRFFALMEAASSFVAPVSYVVTGALLEGLGAPRRPALFAAIALLCLLWSVTLLLRRAPDTAPRS